MKNYLLLHGIGSGFYEMLVMLLFVFLLLGITSLVLSIVHLVKANSGKPVHIGLKVTAMIFACITALPFLGAVAQIGQNPAALLGGLLFLIPLILSIIAFSVEGKKKAAASSDILDA